MDLIKLIETGIKNSLKKKYDDKAEETNIRVHQLYDFCLRRYFLAKKLNKSRINYSYPNTGMLMTRAIGVKFEELILELLKESFEEKVKSKYALKYHFIDNIFLTGEIDIIVGRHICEVKSMKPESFNDVLPDRYIKQVQSYLALSKITNTKINTEFALLVSVCKLQTNPPIKIHTIPFSQKVEDEIVELRSNFQKHYIDKTLPDRICPDLNCLLAKNCNLRNDCFKEEK